MSLGCRGRLSSITPLRKKQLRLNTYLRLHENSWVSSESGLFDMDKRDAYVDPYHLPPLPDRSITLWVGVDASDKKDRSAVVSISGYLGLVFNEYFLPWSFFMQSGQIPCVN